MADQNETASSGSGCLLRLYWLLFGNVLLFFLLIYLFERKPTLPSIIDVIYAVAVASLIVARYVGVRFQSGKTGTGSPDTMALWSRYALLVGSLSTGAWLLVRVLIPCLGRG